ncbi:hypothetical protein ABEB36_008379 [Hypothenemus hampei]|uniref:Short-chain specific acyl-CoA dehydrogenase, mitochondrial n=1 Tax=Hypothenemus hampei TaxID=57062 RepID=A0ABD1ELM8_HYPHA
MALQFVSKLHLRCDRRLFSFYKLSEQHLEIQKTCRNFAETELKPIAAQLDRDCKFPIKQIEKLGELGILGITAAPKYGGCGEGALALSIAVEEISRGCGGTGAIISIHNALYASLVDTFGTDEQKEKFLAPFTCGNIGCFALSESEAGSDVSAISTTATLNGDSYLLNGRKTWVTSALEGKAAIIFATIDKSQKHKGISAFIVPVPSQGLSIGKPEDKMGIRASSTCDYILDNVCIPKENMIGKSGEGFVIAMKQLEKARIGIASQALGIAQAALELAVKYSAERKAFGQPINQLQAVKLRLAEMATRLEAARLLVWRAAILTDEQARTTKYTSMAKLVASEAATFITHGAIQILGGMGYVRDVPAERHYRDARITEIYAGVNDIQKLLIADMIIKEYE